MYKNSFGKWTADLGNGMYKNPILFADYSDPDVIRVNDDFFMTASTFTYFPGLPVLHSKDLVNWKVVSYAVEKMPYLEYAVPQHGKAVWAPAIRYHDGRFYIYFGAPDEGIFMASTSDPFGKWDDLVLVKEAKGWIDPCPFWDDDGNAYLVHAFAKSRIGFKSLLHINKMSPDGKSLLDEGTLVVDGRINHPTIEGPKMYKRNGYYYILAPAGGVKVGWQVALRSKNIYGPYEYKIVLEQRDSPINGPHQGGLVDLESGESWFIHFQDAEAYGRIAHLQPVRWIEDWPIMGEPDCTPVLTHKKPNVGKEYPIETPETTDEFKGDKLGLQWQWQANPNKEFYQLGEAGLKLNSIAIEAENKVLANAPSLLVQLMQSPNFEVVAKIKPNLASDGDMTGICITGGNYYAIKLEREKDKYSLKQVNYELKMENDPEIIIESIDVDELDEIYFKIKVSYDADITFWYGTDENNFTQLGGIAKYSVSSKSWVGGRFGIFSANSKGIKGEGYSVFEYVRFN